MGDGTTTSSYIPVDVNGLTSGVAAVAAGASHTCALMDAVHGGAVKCWGHNYYGQLGNNTVTDSLTPVDVSGLTGGVAAVTAGGYHTCALMDAVHGGGVKCWGLNSAGQLGDDTGVDSSTPVDVSGLTSGAAAVAAGGYHTCAVTAGGGVKCWGDNTYGQLGDDTTDPRLAPVQVVDGDPSGFLSGVAAVAGGGYHTCALKSNGAVKCWGYNLSGQVGDNTIMYLRTAPVAVSGLDGSAGHRAAAVAAGGNHTCAVMDAAQGGGAECWGRNAEGQLGDGTSTNRFAPVQVSGLDGDEDGMADGASHTCAVTTDGRVKCWGGNGAGQLGINPGWTPVDVVAFKGVLAYDLTITLAAEEGILLTWQHFNPAVTGVTGYKVYRGVDPYFTPGEPELAEVPLPDTGPTASHNDRDAFDEPLTSYFYVVADEGNLYQPSNRTGTFNFSLTPADL